MATHLLLTVDESASATVEIWADRRRPLGCDHHDSAGVGISAESERRRITEVAALDETRPEILSCCSLKSTRLPLRLF